MENKENEAVVEETEKVVEQAAEEPMKFKDAAISAGVIGLAVYGGICGAKFVYKKVLKPGYKWLKDKISGKNYVEVDDESGKDVSVDVTVEES